MNRRLDRQRETEQPVPELAAELQRVLEQVGPEHYARATARDFARGGQFNPRPRRPRYALT